MEKIFSAFSCLFFLSIFSLLFLPCTRTLSRFFLGLWWQWTAKVLMQRDIKEKGSLLSLSHAHRVKPQSAGPQSPSSYFVIWLAGWMNEEEEAHGGNFFWQPELGRGGNTFFIIFVPSCVMWRVWYMRWKHVENEHTCSGEWSEAALYVCNSSQSPNKTAWSWITPGENRERLSRATFSKSGMDVDGCMLVYTCLTRNKILLYFREALVNEVMEREVGCPSRLNL